MNVQITYKASQMMSIIFDGVWYEILNCCLEVSKADDIMVGTSTPPTLQWALVSNEAHTECFREADP